MSAAAQDGKDWAAWLTMQRSACGGNVTRDLGAGLQSARQRLWLYCCGVRAAIVFGFAALAGAATPGHGADIELGRYLSSECMTCHGTAKADSTIPNIFGLSEVHIVEVIRAYRAKALPNPVMQTIASGLKDEEIAALAAYFATAKK